MVFGFLVCFLELISCLLAEGGYVYGELFTLCSVWLVVWLLPAALFGACLSVNAVVRCVFGVSAWLLGSDVDAFGLVIVGCVGVCLVGLFDCLTVWFWVDCVTTGC